MTMPALLADRVTLGYDGHVVFTDLTVLDVAGQLGLKQLAIATVNPPAAAPMPSTALPSPDPKP